MWKRILSVLPGIAVSALPKVTCPMCWPAYAGLLSSLGLGFLMSTRYLLPVTTVLLLAAIGALGFRAKARRGYGPMLLGALAAAAVLSGKFYLESDGATYAALALLVGASLWNSWPPPAPSCPECVPAERELIRLNAKEKQQ
jgi:hypothetical protein